MQTTMVDTEKLLPDFTAAAGAFTALLARIPERVFNQVPFEGSWSPAQVGDHVLKFLNGIKSALELPQVVPGRAPDAYDPVLQEIFLNFDRKAKAPAFVEPSKDHIDKTALLGALEQTTEALRSRIGAGGLLTLCEGAPFPTLGDMTGMEWVLFGDYHLQRHARQLEQMQPFFN